MDRQIAEFRSNPDPDLARLGITEVAKDYAAIATALAEPSILVGHSFGGLIVQLLPDRGIGTAGVAIDPAPAELIEYPGRGHFQMAQEGWQEFASRIRGWTNKFSGGSAPKDPRDRNEQTLNGLRRSCHRRTRR
jgi:pimeloyl-ACP methyl ester carboxylesterase